MLSPQEQVAQQMHVRDWTLLKAELDWVYDGKVDPRYRETTRHRTGQSLLLLRQGTVMVRTASGVVRGKPGDWILPSHHDRLQKFSDDAHVLSIHLQLYWPGGEPLFNWSVAGKFKSASVPNLQTESENFQRFVRRIFPSAQFDLPLHSCSLADHARLRHRFSKWFCTFIDVLLATGTLPNRRGEIDSRILQAVQLLDHFPLGRQFDKQEFARLTSLSATHLDRLFTKQFGTSPRRYFERRKLEHAIMHVAQTHSSRTLKEVAFELGFKSPQHFSGWFRQKTGCSPRQLRSQRQRGVGGDLLDFAFKAGPIL